ncbi:MAG: DMT family transporter [Desulfobacteraceae bacterium]|nr:MAG: DMT family transporter [Desulfobacteraceae bacterium]
MTLREWGMLIFLSLIWGGSFFFVGVAVKEVQPFTIVLVRVGLAAFILLAVARVKGTKMPKDPATWGAFLIMGALNNLLPFCLIVWGQTHIESGLASILNAVTPIFSVVLAHFFTREERLTSLRAFGVVMGWIGVAVLIGIEFFKGFGTAVAGQAAVLGAGFCYACAAIYGQRFKMIDPLVVAAGMLTGSTLMMLPLALVADQPWMLSPGVGSILALIGLAAVSTSLAYIIYFRILASSGPTNILLVTFMIPVSAVFLGWVFLGERLGADIFLGMGLIFTGLIAIDGRLVHRLQRWRCGRT